MSEVIVRMEMPKGCYECPMYDFAVYRGKPMLCCNAHFVLKPIPNNGNPRPSWCPIVGELPEKHGDLIDRAWLLKFFDGINDIIDEDDVKCAQTIVPATERSET